MDLAFFYGLNPGDYSLRHVVNVYRGRVPVSLVPIAGDGGDNLICLGVRGNVLGKVFFWYHEGEKPLTGNPENDFSNLYLAADSLRSFVEGLVRRNDSLDAEGLNDVELTLDDDLR